MSAQPLKIVLVTTNVVQGDGQGRVNLELARRVLVAGHDLRVLAADVDAGLLRDGARFTPVRAPRRPVVARVLLFDRAVDRLLPPMLQSEPADLVIANGSVTTHRHGLNLAHFVHAAWQQMQTFRLRPGSVYQRAFTQYNARRERLTYARAGRIATPSQQTAGELRAIGVAPNKITVVPNGVDLDEYRPGPSDRTSLGLPNSVPLLLFAGDLRTNRKGLGHVLHAVQRMPEVHLVIVGRVEGSPYPAEAERLGIAGRVRFLGFRRDMASIMRACDLFVLPTSYDTFGMVISEALACGLPVVTSAAAGASELMNEACGSVLKDPSDIDGLVAAIAAWIDSPGRASGAAESCRQAVLNHGWANMAESYLRLIEDTAAASRHDR